MGGSPGSLATATYSLLLLWSCCCCCEWLQHGHAVSVLPTICVITAVRFRGGSITGGILTDSLSSKTLDKPLKISVYDVNKKASAICSRSGSWLRTEDGWATEAEETRRLITLVARGKRGWVTKCGLLASTTTSNHPRPQTPIAMQLLIISIKLNLLITFI